MDLSISAGSALSNSSTPIPTQPLMHILPSALLLGSFALQAVLGRPNLIGKRDVDDFVDFETPIALEKLLCNIGADGCAAAGAAPGVVIASPDRADPPYFFTWTRDSALVFKSIVDRFTDQYDANLQRLIQEFVGAQAKLQGVSNPSGSLSDGRGLGEAKFEVDLTEYMGAWGRPQRDGPALRAIALLGYAQWLIENGYESTANDIVWPVVRNDLEYSAQYWTQPGFDLWEEVNGQSFFTVASLHRALVEGASVARQLGKSGDKYANIAPQILCYLQNFWVSNGGYVDSNINVNDGRTGKDANSVLASIHLFDPTIGCNSATFQPCSDRALSNLKAVVDSFRFYGINNGIPTGRAIAVGRYAEDVYYQGNPWYLNTLAVAEQLYDALYVWKQQGSVTVSQTSLSFFRDLLPGIATGTYASNSATYTSIITAVSNYADGFVAKVQQYTPSDGSLAEQYSKFNGSPVGARDLTWSYAAFLTATSRRAGIVPPTWVKGANLNVPGTCSATTAVGSYTSATRTSFPPSQTPTDGVPSPTNGGPTPTGSPAPCTTATSVDVTFEVRVRTQFGQTIKIVGDASELGQWNTGNAVALSASSYTNANPVWKGTVTLPAGAQLAYKYINVGVDGSVTWESDPNRQYTVPKTCETTATEMETWR
ncbi:Glucoamylase-like protein [Emericellopsis cladophorae]|uniref:Glucoamylase n=1 Tax=Emericellopsis cladophorae TaxID=2686198 RepID=A0A9P9XZM5_9HYPO|nr:Glucoamylase-like protein [Emericellopsis cladophorae]KAI6780390.1 Glucoamylase-like protein [Emericellopsis cladophorae]